MNGILPHGAMTDLCYSPVAMATIGVTPRSRRLRWNVFWEVGTDAEDTVEHRVCNTADGVGAL